MHDTKHFLVAEFAITSKIVLDIAQIIILVSQLLEKMPKLVN
jgi:hypothetical protein